MIRSGPPGLSTYIRVNFAIHRKIVIAVTPHHMHISGGRGHGVLVGKGIFRILTTTLGQRTCDTESQDYLSFEPNYSQ